eukprot:TRINITY_DN24728_c0_g1_i2.p1 TRINITY_DN24728_c0_g1~~TRINITY_DN24728_c0_g1_i2.p1  ORF type:complete len:602 (+),score=198.17 TRINITY_DN24728_c0_g1_i2:100-1905(+)
MRRWVPSLDDLAAYSEELERCRCEILQQEEGMGAVLGRWEDVGEQLRTLMMINEMVKNDGAHVLPWFVDEMEDEAKAVGMPRYAAAVLEAMRYMAAIHETPRIKGDLTNPAALLNVVSTKLPPPCNPKAFYIHPGCDHYTTLHSIVKQFEGTLTESKKEADISVENQPDSQYKKGSKRKRGVWTRFRNVTRVHKEFAPPSSDVFVTTSTLGLRPKIVRMEDDLYKPVEVTAAYLFASREAGELLDPLDFAVGGYLKEQLQGVWYTENTERAKKRTLKTLQNTLSRKTRRVVVQPLAATWYRPHVIHRIEREDEGLRTIALDDFYVETRDWLVRSYRTDPGRYFTYLLMRRSVPGNDTVLLVIYKFVSQWGLINYALHPLGKANEVVPMQSFTEEDTRTGQWKEEEETSLVRGVENYTRADTAVLEMPSIAAAYVPGKTPRECLVKFTEMALTEEELAEPPEEDTATAAGNLAARIADFIKESAPEGYPVPEEMTIETAAPTALGILQAKAALIAEREEAELKLILNQLLHLQSHRIVLLLEHLAATRQVVERELRRIPAQYAQLYHDFAERRTRLRQLIQRLDAGIEEADSPESFRRLPSV